jgi:ubiquinone/menaquinone biosynthesis C-methylase UbiE
MDKRIAEKLLNQTRENYNNFAESFSATRNYLWPEAIKILGNDWKSKSNVLDIGCGNGRYYSFFKEKDVKYVGIDNSASMISIARKKFPEGDFEMADALDLPFEANEFDGVVSFSVIHHIPSKELRKKFIQEAWRVLKPGGILVVTAWDLRPLTMVRSRQWKRFKGFLNSQIKKIFFLEKNDFGDFSIPWQNKYRRYIHIFTLGELKNLVENEGFSIEKIATSKLGIKEGNLYIVAKKCEKDNVARG